MDENSKKELASLELKIYELKNRVEFLEEQNELSKSEMEERCEYFSDEISKLNKKVEISRIIFFIIIIGIMVIIFRNFIF